MNFVQNFFKNWFTNLIVLLALFRFYPGFLFPTDFPSQLIAAFVLTAIITFFQPILKMIVLPVNIITFGLFNWLLEALVLLLLTILIDNVTFQSFNWKTFTFFGVTFSGGGLNSFFSVIIGSIFFKFLTSLVKYLTSD